jgi:glycosyltransferase involved in cell wall biosynthesis
MNILLLTNELSRTNGWATVSFYLKKELDKNHRVSVITKEDLKADEYYNPYTLIAAFMRVAKRIESCDVIICNVEPYLPLAALLKRKYGARLLLVGHGTYAYFPFRKGWKGKYNRFFAKSVDRIVVPSQYTKDKVKSWWPYEVDLVKWGVDTRMYHPVSARKEKAFVFVGAQKERKGVRYLILAFEKLLKDDPDVKLYLLGEINNKYREIVAEKGMQETVLFKGHVSHDELLKYLSTGICHVLPSVNTDFAFEGFGLVHLEANACGIPSIGSKMTANESAIKPGVSGFLVAPGNINELHLAMKKIIADPDNTLKLCASSLNYAKQNTWSANLAPFVDIVERLVESSSKCTTEVAD